MKDVLDVKNWMEDRSVDIIRLTKSFAIANDIKSKVAKYMSETCNCPIERYTDDILLKVLKHASYDYIHNASPEAVKAFTVNFIENDFPGFAVGIDEFTRLCLALRGTKVCEEINGEWVYVDGFHDTKFSKQFDDPAFEY